MNINHRYLSAATDKKIKIISIVFLFLSILTFIYAIVLFHFTISIQIFGSTLHSRLEQIFFRTQIIYPLGLSTLSIPLGLGLTVIKILQKQWLRSILLLAATAASGLFVVDFIIAFQAGSRAFSSLLVTQ